MFVEAERLQCSVVSGWGRKRVNCLPWTNTEVTNNMPIGLDACFYLCVQQNKVKISPEEHPLKYSFHFQLSDIAVTMK